MAVNRSPAAAPFEEAKVREPPAVGEAEAAAALDRDWQAKQQLLQNSPIIAFLKAHEVAGTPNEITITGVADVKVTLGDLRAFVRAVE